MKADVVIVGAGPAGIFTAIEMLKLGSHRKIVIVEKGQSVEKRHCPKSVTKHCMNCKPFCHITTGFSGAGAFSDGKLSLSYEVGGDLPTLAGNYQKVIDLVREYCPDAIIYVEANIHVSANPAAVASVNNTNINAFNELLKGLCDGKTIFYLDVNPVFDDANGNLGDEYSSDGIHFSAQYYKQWADWIAQNAIVLK